MSGYNNSKESAYHYVIRAAAKNGFPYYIFRFTEGEYDGYMTIGKDMMPYATKELGFKKSEAMDVIQPDYAKTQLLKEKHASSRKPGVSKR